MQWLNGSATILTCGLLYKSTVGTASGGIHGSQAQKYRSAQLGSGLSSWPPATSSCALSCAKPLRLEGTSGKCNRCNIVVICWERYPRQPGSTVINAESTKPNGLMQHTL